MASPEVEWPARPARPTICFIFAEIDATLIFEVPPEAEETVLNITRSAGKLTPAERVEVAHKTMMVRFRKPTSIIDRSSLVIPAW